MSSISDVIRTFEDRLSALEDVVGDSNDVDLYGVVELMVAEVNKMFYEGQKYSEQLMGLLDEFSENKIIDAFEDKSRIIVSCYDGLKKSLKDLDHLDSLVRRLGRALETPWLRCPVVEMDSIRKLPDLTNKCHSLLIYSILVAKRFMETNLRFNEFWIKTGQRLDRLH